MNLQEISLGRHAPSIVNVVIEASKDSQEKDEPAGNLPWTSCTFHCQCGH
jgi:hypothetical protein